MTYSALRQAAKVLGRGDSSESAEGDNRSLHFDGWVGLK